MIKKLERDTMGTSTLHYSVFYYHIRDIISLIWTRDCRDILCLKLKVAVLKGNTLPKLDIETNETLEA